VGENAAVPSLNSTSPHGVSIAAVVLALSALGLALGSLLFTTL